jgi:hypothetical protein
VAPQSYIEKMNSPHRVDRLLRHSWMLSLTLIPYYVKLGFISDCKEAPT